MERRETNTRIDREEKLIRIEKEIAELHQKCDPVHNLMKTIDRMESEMDVLIIDYLKEETPKSEAKEKTKKKKQKKKVKQANEVSKSVTPDQKSEEKTAIARPDSIPEDIWQRFYELGNFVA
ncbi:hypothetical protein PENTCL1PPCAC_23870, partial [Pristionchus entomophagus]